MEAAPQVAAFSLAGKKRARPLDPAAPPPPLLPPGAARVAEVSAGVATLLPEDAAALAAPRLVIPLPARPAAPADAPPPPPLRATKRVDDATLAREMLQLGLPAGAHARARSSRRALTPSHRAL